MQVSATEAQTALEVLLKYIGEDPDREGLRMTPFRVVQSYMELFSGYGYSEKAISNLFTTFEDGACDEIVLLKEVEFFSFCEHHMLPFFGKIHVAYLPQGKVIGLSKIARLIEVYSRRLQIQERLTQQITSALDEHLQPQGSACIVEATHFCMVARGVQKQNSVAVTSSMTGIFRHPNDQIRQELFSLLGDRK